jgi:hypothetical protein
MPPLCLCAASVPLHESLVSDLEGSFDHQDHYHHHRHHHHHHHQNRKCTKLIYEVSTVETPSPFDLIGQVRGLCDSILRPHYTKDVEDKSKEIQSSVLVPALRSDLAEIPRVGFPPNQPRICHSGAIGKHNRSSRRSTHPTSSSNFPDQEVAERLAVLCSAHGSGSLVFCRIEAIYI